ncbi:MAG: hypothetical protein AAFY58_00965 [Planctomycetota bacterium]
MSDHEPIEDEEPQDIDTSEAAGPRHEDEMEDVPSSPAAENPPPKDRREFIRRAGAALIAITVVGSAGGSLAQPNDISVDTDKLCSPQVYDDGIARSTEAEADADQACNATTPDASCQITSAPGGSSLDHDENCGKRVKGSKHTDPDESCGDCDDNHATDENCGKTKAPSGELDQDELCGHVHGIGSVNSDNSCGQGGAEDGSSGDIDEGCGTHKPLYSQGGASDTDDNCGSKDLSGKDDPDSNCTGNPEGDDTCNQNQPAYASSSDESCGNSDGVGGIDQDEACGSGGSKGYNGAYDMDESCVSGGGSEDEACTSHADFSWHGVPLTHTDTTDTDQNA